MLSTCELKTSTDADRSSEIDHFKSGVERLRDVKQQGSVYQVAAILWDLWQQHLPAIDSYWLVATTESFRLAGISSVSNKSTDHWGNYHSIDDTISFDETILFRISSTRISFGNNPKPCFWGMYQYLRRVRKQLSRTRKVYKTA